MRKRNIYFIGLLFVVMVFGSSTAVLAAEEASTMMCDEGVVNIGDTDADVQEKCGEPREVLRPDSQDPVKWVYDLGGTYYVSIVNGKVERIQVGE